KSDPTGTTPPNLQDPQFNLWETGLQLWLQKNGLPSGTTLQESGLSPTSTTPTTTPQTLPNGQPIQTTQGVMIPIGPGQ
ncbi:MAG TPA: hypothetical protein VN665_02110, partial [Candidatus Paceibacterota bacterium]|nr:hypothetical protein [Candidatus Paceibacterota bacterium]